MSATNLAEQCQAKLFVLRVAVADLLGQQAAEVDDFSSFDSLFSGTRGFESIWQELPQLHERQLRVSRDWTLASLAMEWQKADNAHC
ncbi:MAG: hypothetical protein Q7R93_02680 [bacterium]|nr:hypothetical protein [bacterium]